MSEGLQLDDETVLRLAGAAGAAYGLHWLLASEHAHSTYMAARVSYDAATCRWFGFTLGMMGGQNFAVAAVPASKSAKKNLLKWGGIAWAASVALGLYHVTQGSFKSETAVPSALLHGALAALCLWRGFAKD